MLNNISKIIVKTFGMIIIILLIVESSLIIPAYFNLVFSTHSIASSGARQNYLTSQDINDLKKIVTNDFTNDRYENMNVVTSVLKVGPEGNHNYSNGSTYGNNLVRTNLLQRGDTYLITVVVDYYLLTPHIFNNGSSHARRLGIPIKLKYEVAITCLEYIKELD